LIQSNPATPSGARLEADRKPGVCLRAILLLPTVVAILLAPASAAAGADAARGGILYQASCGECHAQSVHGRPHRQAADFEAVRAWVRRWSASLGLAWTAQEIDDVSAWLNERYYRFPCPTTVCTTTGRAGDEGVAVAARRP